MRCDEFGLSKKYIIQFDFETHINKMDRLLCHTRNLVHTNSEIAWQFFGSPEGKSIEYFESESNIRNSYSLFRNFFRNMLYMNSVKIKLVQKGLKMIISKVIRRQNCCSLGQVHLPDLIYYGFSINLISLFAVAPWAIGTGRGLPGPHYMWSRTIHNCIWASR